MLVVVAYDVNTETPAGRRRLRRVAGACKDWGQRVQFSVFECLLDPAQWTALRRRLIDEIDEDRDSLRFYFLGSNYAKRIEQVGLKKSYDPEGPLIV